MRILDRLVLGTFVKLFVISILATPPLFILGNLTERLDDFIEAELTALDIAHGYLYNLPEYVMWSFPVAALIAAVFTVHGMTTHREIVAAKAGGVSFHRLVLPLVLLGLTLTGVALASMDMVPITKRRSTEIFEQRQSQRGWRSMFAYQTEDGMLLSVQRMDAAQGQMMTVGIHRPATERDSSYLHAYADVATYDSLGWRFDVGSIRRVFEDGTESTMRFQSMRIPSISESPEDLLEEPREEEEMTYDELARQARIVERSGGDAAELWVKREQKIALPVATFVIILFGAPLATSAKRGGAAYGIGIALGSTILYILCLKITQAFGASGALPPLWAAWIPNLVFFTAGVLLMARVRT